MGIIGITIGLLIIFFVYNHAKNRGRKTVIDDDNGIIDIKGTVVEEEMLSCPVCGRHIEDDFIVCPYCRTPLD